MLPCQSIRPFATAYLFLLVTHPDHACSLSAYLTHPPYSRSSSSAPKWPTLSTTSLPLHHSQLASTDFTQVALTINLIHTAEVKPPRSKARNRQL
ncbi:hypothetical protein TcWFU_003035 [Taenia crassiceps]|uniref:Secreted protein n=1 Tax=Taenia crassiceps TaxID=6207 RepID=A0ABR4QAW0_9CEST